MVTPIDRVVRLVLEAARDLADGHPADAHARSDRVVRRALEAAGLFTPAAGTWLADEVDDRDPEAEHFYDVLVRLVHGTGWSPYLAGQGNFGGVCYGYPDSPPAHPKYTACRITTRGLEFLRDTAG